MRLAVDSYTFIVPYQQSSGHTYHVHITFQTLLLQLNNIQVHEMLCQQTDNYNIHTNINTYMTLYIYTHKHTITYMYTCTSIHLCFCAVGPMGRFSGTIPAAANVETKNKEGRSICYFPTTVKRPQKCCDRLFRYTHTHTHTHTHTYTHTHTLTHSPRAPGS